MRVFVTGATGWVGSAVVADLIGAGHQVLGLCRAPDKAAALAAAGAEVHHGSLQDQESLKRGAEQADGVIHLAFNHDFTNFAQNGADERRAIAAIGEVLVGSDRPLVVTSGVALLAPGTLATEQTPTRPESEAFPRNPEAAAAALRANGVRVTAVRLAPSVHGHGDHGFVPRLIQLAREKGVSPYIGEGVNRWPAVHRVDAARVFRLALERGAEGGPFHAIAEEGVPFRDIAAVIGRRLGVPVVSQTAEEAAQHFGWFTRFAAIDCPAASAHTRALLGWTPAQPGLLADLDHPAYFTV
ncbi:MULTISPECIES: SDR family oxidoreductase [Nitrospirillum]|uniref:Nucleoside-diphosphate-sugar epimerase n=1 Tax=Nitrospirillum amazonense TaxID=28077 RepID=A0A560G5E9_9PROT|nr:SDR family oxidoreductase [Nitrospirillum amazonense]MEC4592860.1 SDR family oxidoreductase [Nitrospirillum amazonense]TWB29051.1 nucleoside-diphosphate-sugar epimerase [Nitrospirillum amazonense]